MIAARSRLCAHCHLGRTAADTPCLYCSGDQTARCRCRTVDPRKGETR